MPYSVPFNSATRLLHVGLTFSIKYESVHKQEEDCLQVNAAVTNEEIMQHLAVGFTESVVQIRCSLPVDFTWARLPPAMFWAKVTTQLCYF